MCYPGHSTTNSPMSQPSNFFQQFSTNVTAADLLLTVLCTSENRSILRSLLGFINPGLFVKTRVLGF